MQEQAPSNITPQQGWSQMKIVLDREMPEERRSRRLIFFWWTMAAVAIVMTSGYFVWTSSIRSGEIQENKKPAIESPAKESPVPAEQPVFAQNEKTQMAGSAGQESNLATTPSLSKENPANLNNAPISKQSKSTSSRVKNIDQRPAYSEMTTPQAHQPENTIASQGTAATTSMKGKEAERMASTSEASEPADVTIAKRAIEKAKYQEDQLETQMERNGKVVFAVPALSYNELSIPSVEIVPIEVMPTMPVKTEKKSTGLTIHPFAATSAMGSWNGGGGIYASAGVDLKVKPRLGVHAGFGYGSFDPSLSFAKRDAVALDATAEYGGIIQNDNVYPGVVNYINEESLDAGTTYESLNPIIERFNQWQGEIGLTYDVSKRWFVQAGVMMNFHTNAFSRYPIISTDATGTPGAVKLSHSLDGYEVVRNTLTSVAGGIGLHIGKHVDLSTQLIYGFQPYLLAPESTGTGIATGSGNRKDYIRGLSLGLKYSL